MRLFHLSDDPTVTRFEPRPSAHMEQGVVWAIAAERIAHYLLPRDCPRVCFRAGPESTKDDVETLLGPHAAVVAIEADWEERVRTEKLYRYALPSGGFALLDAGAGYYVSQEPVAPTGMEVIDDLPAAIAGAGATLLVLPSLWDLHDAVAESSLVFSMIRMRNAAVRAP
ncbi:MAG: hypothetical protein ABS76_29805 [Pelagibacterium sp. SCN 64-44]|nr:MAG: hypothetical protein ABS76_29805 [Pelagibacterium sp. SCN 64-44]